MQVTELSAEGLKREYKVVVEAAEIEGQVAHRLEELKGRIRMPGFRPGKVPIALLRKQYGRSLRGEVLEQAVNRGSQKAIADHELRPALRPKIEVTSFDEGADLEFTMALEVLPEVPEVDLKKIELTRLVAEVGEETIAGALDRFAKRFQEYEPPSDPRPSRTGDRLIIDFEGQIDGEVFEGGKAEDIPLVLGSGFMLPGFEEQLTGVEAGADVTVQATFPEGYPNADLAGKAADLRGQSEGGERAQADGARRRSGQGSGIRWPGGARGRGPRRHRQGIRAGLAGQGEARAARPPRGELPLPGAGGHGRPGIRGDLEAAQARDGARRRGDRRRQVRGGAEGRVPDDRRAAGPSRPDPLGHWPEERDQGRAARAQRGDHGPGAPVSRAGAEGPRFLPQQPFGRRSPARAALRGQGGRLHPADGQRRRTPGNARGTDGRSGRRGRGGGAGRLVRPRARRDP